MPQGGFLSHSLFLCNIWAVAMAQATLPYIPTHVFNSPQASNNSSFVYVLQPNSNQTGVELLALNVSSIDPSSPQYTVLYESVPFFTGNEAFVPILDSNGSITVFTGNCQAPKDTPLLWSFQPDESSSIGNGTWSSASVDDSSTNENVTGPGYLASGFAFSSTNNTSPEYYTFAGMCPFDNSTQSDWTSNADYSNEMTVLSQQNSSTASNSFVAQQTDSSNSPIAEAGYTVIPLQKTSSTTSGGNTVEQETFLFIGGHTQSAFLNMSTLALFSVPQASWTYIPVSSNTGTDRTDLAIRDSQIEPRSGHSAVISSDGSKVIVFGGWVGDTTTAADPQLVILEVGEDYGGSGEWAWSTPEPTGTGPATGSGIFGHATTMLNEDVMMISGGFVISASSGTSKRASSTTLETSSQVYLYNLTSNAWTSSYTSSSSSSTTAPSSQGSGALSSSGEKAGLGVGISAAAIAVVGLGYLCWSRKRWRHRQRRDQELRKLALGAERSNIWGEPGLESSYRGPSEATLRNSILENLYYTGPSHHYSAVVLPENTRTEAERSGLLYDVPSPSRGLRRSLSNRPQRIQPASRYEENRRSYGPGIIHSIDEREEYETPPETAENEPEEENTKSNRFSDPFMDPHSPTSVPLIASVEKPAQQQQEGTDSSSILSAKSRSVSPDKAERTHSDLSESSRSGISELSVQRSIIGSHDRPVHLFQTAIPTLEPSNHSDSVSGRSSPEKSSSHAGRPDTDGSMRWPFQRSATIDSSTTSASRHRRTPLEGDTLLGSGPEWATPPESPSRLSDRENRHSNSLTLMGSIRKTLSSAKRAVLSGYGNSSEEEDTINNRRATMFDFTSPVEFDDQPLSRPASSASIAHLQRKQGPRDWAVEGSRNSQTSPSFSTPRRRRMLENNDQNEDDDAFNDELDVIDHDQEHGAGDGDDGDWDVEAAAEGRLVQITYTIPKERLRVVNAGAGDRVIGDDISEVISRTSQEGK